MTCSPTIDVSMRADPVPVPAALDELLEHFPAASVLVDASGRLRKANARAVAALETMPNRLLQAPLSQFLESMAGNCPLDQPARLVRSEPLLCLALESRRRFYLSACELRAMDQPLWLVTLEAETETAAPVERGALLETVFAAMEEGLLLLDENFSIIAANPAFCILTGYDAAELLGRHVLEVSTGSHVQFEHIRSELQQTQRWRGEIVHRSKSGRDLPAILNIRGVPGPADDPDHYVGIYSDMTPLRFREERIEQLAHYSPVTNLPNRKLFIQRLQGLLANSRDTDQHAALLLLDIDDFKRVNDSLGHEIGDDLLAQIGKRLELSLRDQDTIGHLGGDEFGILLTDIDANVRVGQIAEHVLQTVRRPVQAGHQEIGLSASIGVAMIPRDGNEPPTLLRNADAAMYLAKSNGGDRLHYFTQDVSLAAVDRLSIETGLRRAIRNQELRLVFQPLMDLRQSRFTGAEALLRWTSPHLGDVSPARFIPVAESSGLIESIGEWVLNAACHQLRNWGERGPQRINVNLSARQFRSRDLERSIRQTLRDHRLPGTRLGIELTETALLDDTEAAIDTLRVLAGLGISVSIDDFGVGYSSLSYLKRLPIDVLKIDRSFITDIPHDSDHTAITETIVAMARTLRMSVVAEGVETPSQLDFLRRIDCDCAQGYLFSKPVEPDQLLKLFSR